MTAIDITFVECHKLHAINNKKSFFPSSVQFKPVKLHHTYFFMHKTFFYFTQTGVAFVTYTIQLNLSCCLKIMQDLFLNG
jgi:hypothetical protein